MGLMPGEIVKGPLLAGFDDHINQNRANLQAALNEYRNPANTLDDIVIWGVTRGILAARDYAHVVDDWLPEIKTPANANPLTPRSWWPKFFPFGGIVREGLIRALSLCEYLDPDAGVLAQRPQALPVDSFWLCAGSHLQIVATLGYAWVGGNREPHHVNMLILTPPAPGSDRGANFVGHEDIWVVRPTDQGPGISIVRPGQDVETVRPRR